MPIIAALYLLVLGLGLYQEHANNHQPQKERKELPANGCCKG